MNDGQHMAFGDGWRSLVQLDMRGVLSTLSIGVWISSSD
jgi:hypothetical protein